MKSFSSILTIAAIFTLTACGGGGSAGSGGAGGDAGGGGDGSGNPGGGGQAPVVKLNDVRQVIEYHGDSTIFGWVPFSNGDQVDRPAPEAFAANIASQHTVRNEGRNGTTACDMLIGRNGYERDGAPFEWADRMSESDATVIIINHALNDMGESSRDQYRGCLGNLVDIAQAAGKVVILETPNPAEDGTDDGSHLAGYVADMLSIASQKGVNVIDQYAHLRQEQWGGTEPREVSPDGLHPSQDIYIEKGRYAAERFKTFDQP